MTMMKIEIGERTVELDQSHLKFTDATINDYLHDYSSWYAYYIDQGAYAQACYLSCENKLDQLRSAKFKEIKERIKVSDKLAEAYVDSDAEVAELAQQTLNAKFAMQRIQGFLKALDKSFDSVLNVGYNIRKEMDKLYPKQIQPTTPWYDGTQQ